MLWAGPAAIVVLALLAWPYTVDDAFIIARYARNLAAGHGYAFNPGSPSDGVTGPLWLLPGWLACLAGGDPIAVAKLLGIACAASAVWLTLRRARARSGGRIGALACALLLVLNPSISSLSVSGLETAAATLAVAIAAWSASRRPRPAGWTLGFAIAALAWLRPELAFASTVLLGYALLRDARAGTRALAIAASAALALFALRMALFGAPLPLSFYAKTGTLAHGLSYSATALGLATSFFGCVLAGYGALRGRSSDRAFAVALLAHLFAIVLSGGDWMPGYRLLVPVLPLYAALAANGVARAHRARPKLAWLALAFSCSVPVLDLATRIPDLRAAGESQRKAATLAVFLREHARSVALVDIGYLGYASGIEVVDLGGLTDPPIAHMHGGHLRKRIDPDYLERRAPEAIVLHSSRAPVVDDAGRLRDFSGYPVEQRVAAMPFVRDRYRVHHTHRYAPGYEYVVLLREARVR